MKLQLDLMTLTAVHKGETVRLNDICFQPLAPDNTECTVFSALQYYQLNTTTLDKCVTNLNEDCDDPDAIGAPAEDWHDQFLDCTRYVWFTNSEDKNTKKSILFMDQLDHLFCYKG